MLLELKNRRLNVIGDVHLGKVFKTGVPLDRRGEREEMVWAQFERELALEADLTVQVGDIFDRFSVPEAIVLRAAAALRKAAKAGQRIVLLRGNHDAVRDADKRSSFDVLKALMDADFPTEHGIDVVTQHLVVDVDDVDFLFLGWNPFVPAADLVQHFADGGDHFDGAVFGHWDITAPQGKTHNLIPLRELAAITDTVVTGHDHIPRRLSMMGLDVVVTGSMQPYSFAEDPYCKIYVTSPLAEVEEVLGIHDGEYHNRCLRIITKPGEIMPTDIDCLQLVEKRVTEAGEDLGEVDVEFDPFDLNKIVGEALSDAGVGAELAAKVAARLGEARNA